MLLRAGDIAWVELGPVRGSEQDGRRPALFLSDSDYHEISRRAVICPISSTERPWPFHVPLPAGLATTGFVLVDQIRTIDRTERMFDFIEHAPHEVLSMVRDRVAALLGCETVVSNSDPSQAGAT
jgi:mRNA interferase MazF